LTQAAAASAITGATLSVGAITNANSATVAAGSVISQSPLGGASVPPGTSVALTVSIGPANVTVPGVVGLTQAAATSAITGATLSVGAITNANSATVPAGSVISQNPLAGASVAPNSAVALTISLGPAATAVPTVQVNVSSDGTGPRTTPAFSTTTPGELLIALVASDGPPIGANTQTLTISGGGLAWSRLQRAATARGVAEIWTATAPGVLTGVSVTSTQSVATINGLPANQALTVLAFTGAGGVGASANTGATTGAPRINVVTQGAGSVIYGVGVDFDRAVARTVPAGQTKVHEFLAPSGDTMWMQSLNAPTGAAGSTATLNDTAPSTDQWNFAAVEILSGAPPVPVAVPDVVGVTQASATTAITTAGLTVGTITSANSATVPAGSVISESPLAGTSVPTGSAVALVVSLGPAPAGPAVDASASSDGTGTRTTPAFSTTVAGDVLVAFAASDEPGVGVNNQNLTISGAGLVWTRVARAATSRGVSEIWTATAAGVLTNVTVSSAQSVKLVNGLPVNQSLTVIAFKGATGIGASNVASALTGAPRVTLVAQAAGSAIFGVGNDFDQAVARTLPAGQTKVHEFLAPTGDTMWVQSLNAATTAAGVTVTLNDTAPVANQWNFAIVEIKR
jgi:beta-lactam-binding protein with PASTA domain